MTKEQKQEAEEYFKSICEDYNEEYERTGKRHYFVGFDIKNAYIASAEPREKRIAELEAENEKLNNRCKKYEQQISAMESGTCTVCSEVDKELQLTYAKTIIQDLLDNTDEYARQRAEDFLKESK